MHKPYGQGVEVLHRVLILKQHILIPICLLSLAWGKAAATEPHEPVSFAEVQGKVSFLTSAAQQASESNVEFHPFLSSSLPNPPNYKGSLFKLNHDYPSEVKPETNFPWYKVTNKGAITTKNANAYVLALKDYVADDIKKLLYQPDQPNNPNWFQSIWLGTEREPIHGMYVGSGFPAGTLTGQSLDLTTYVYTLYDRRAAKTLGDIWGRTEERAFNPQITKETTQYAEGSVIVKFSFVTPCGSDWAPMSGTSVWQIYAPVNVSNGSARSPASKCKNNGSNGNSSTPVLTNLYFMQFDIIVKDTLAAPETGWVFSTLVYDKSAKGSDVWEKMVPLGATWGGNPDVVNLKETALTPPVQVNMGLSQNWINMNTPEYARSTLGWDGRLSGPNDGAVVTPAWAGSEYYHKGLATAGCLGCHSSAQYPMTSFLLPSQDFPPQTIAPPLSSDQNAAALVIAKPGSLLWMKWFQSNSGSMPMGPATPKGVVPVALDYDMVTAFKAIPMWQAAVKARASKK